jgi:hypothetical protein
MRVRHLLHFFIVLKIGSIRPLDNSQLVYTGEFVNIRQLVLDVDKAMARPSLLQIATAISRCTGVDAANITVEEIDLETVGMGVTIEGSDMNYEEIVDAIEATGAVVHSLDQIAFGNKIIARNPRAR